MPSPRKGLGEVTHIPSSDARRLQSDQTPVGVPHGSAHAHAGTDALTGTSVGGLWKYADPSPQNARADRVANFTGRRKVRVSAAKVVNTFIGEEQKGFEVRPRARAGGPRQNRSTIHSTPS